MDPDRKVDFANCWRALGINPKDGKIIQRKLKLTWHHIDDLDENINSTMQLLYEEAHVASLSHSGSVAQWKVLFRLIQERL
ncbi:HNH endonuclease [Tenacibaculum tangerinum]|uniref:HNH endonuclease n=1 Tax=Tenacibaculum tangerinum TaxID=3038772 RepID=A0ABY8L399_9FLAO|nr:HNH endonuclease [Tenacibaculum tangerinum]WGH75107.1 HNH endonuclease [Tenacibaculum tangerinum]